jgi:hypothetical protein
VRIPIAVKIEPYDLDAAGAKIHAAVDALAEYVMQAPRSQNLRSKYGLLGPAGKAITELKAGRYDRDSLIGYTLRTQESVRTGQFTPHVTVSVLNALEGAVDRILGLLREAPEAHRAAILERLDYGLYYRLRRRQLQEKEKARKEWIGLLAKKYVSSGALSAAWGRPVADYQDLPLPTKQPPIRKQRSATEQADVDEFWASRAELIDED